MRLRQLPELYLRGSIAQETMKHLTQEQQLEVGLYTTAIMNNPRLAPNRTEFTKMLGQTIAADYRENREAADQECAVAIWRGVVHLLYHRSYSFLCNACGESAYLTQRGKPAAFDRRYPSCPNCHQVQITDPGDSRLQPGGYAHRDELLLTVPEGGVPPSTTSPITAIPGERKVADPYVILNDPEQQQKFFSEFIWNSFRQILNENEIRQHQLKPQQEVGFADQMAVLEIRGLLRRYRISHNYCDRSEPKDGYYHFYLNTGAAPPEFVVDFAELLHKYRGHEVPILYDDHTIRVANVPAPRMVEASVVRPTPVLMAAPRHSIGDSHDDSCIIDQLEFKLVGGLRTPQENPVRAIESEEIVDVIRNALPDGHCRDTYDLITGHGALYLQYSDSDLAGPGGSFTRPGQIAKVLGLKPKEVTNHFNQIKVYMLAYGMTPQQQEEEYV